jgi:hypothetical protein
MEGSMGKKYYCYLILNSKGIPLLMDPFVILSNHQTCPEALFG